MIQSRSFWGGDLEALCPVPAWGRFLPEHGNDEHHLFGAAASLVPPKQHQPVEFAAHVMLPAQGDAVLNLLKTSLGFARSCLYTTPFLSLMGTNQAQTKHKYKYRSSWLSPC